jgi:carboxyl-terminal processing protease
MTFKRAFAVAALALTLSSVAGAQKFIGSPAQDLFDQATFYLDTQYFGPSKVDIKAVTATYQTKLDEACAAQALQCGFDKVEPLLEEMFAALEDPHAYYLSPEDVKQLNAQTNGTAVAPTPRVGFSHGGFVQTTENGKTQTVTFGAFSPTLIQALNGGQAKLISNDRLILNVLPNSPAEKAGMRFGDRWVGINGILFSSYAKVEDLVAAFTNFGQQITAGQTVRMNMVRGAERIAVELTVKGELVSLTQTPTLEIRADGIAVISIRDYALATSGQTVHDLIAQAIARNVKGIIFNLRGNGGGRGQNQVATTAALAPEGVTYQLIPRYNGDSDKVEWAWVNGNTVVRRLVNRPSVIFESLTIKSPQLYKGPIAVLVDSGCASACEYFAATMQHAKRGLVVGEDTFGIGNTNTGPFALINGGRAQMPTIRAFWPDGTSLPSTIKPDITSLNFELELFNTGIDPGLTKAIESLGIKTLSASTSSVTLRAPVSIPAMAGADLMGNLRNSVDLRAPHSEANLQTY